MNKYMLISILTGALWVFVFGLLMLLTPIADVFRDQEHLLTGYFNFFIFAAIFNGFNTRTEKFNLFENINRNKIFLAIMGLILVAQIIITYVGGKVLGCYGLNLQEWAVVLLGALVMIPVDLIKKAVLKAGE